jgi:hypothetical protein
MEGRLFKRGDHGFSSLLQSICRAIFTLITVMNGDKVP